METVRGPETDEEREGGASRVEGAYEYNAKYAQVDLSRFFLFTAMFPLQCISARNAATILRRRLRR
jgi:hypothetical protein